jgi:eukaryotic-like serine/threonine-protein kinase
MSVPSSQAIIPAPMALTLGTRLGPYEIQSPLGAGGMGEVYRARDTRLGRDVAIKVLPSHLSSNPDLKARFEREARAISALSHPHICHLYDIGSQDGTDYLVMELLEGESLDKRLEKGPLPLKQALEVGVEIAEALEKAHKHGIVHRDLKPGNIVLTKAGAKLLDFGLAKPHIAAIGAIAGASSGKLTPSTPTMSVAALASPAGGLTQQGTIVGTFQYMAPECLQGQEADARSDLFSFGCVLYEMVTGRRAFEGKSQLSVLTAILEKDPEPVSTVQPGTPVALEHAIQTCLEKNPEERVQTAHDLRVQLAWVAKASFSTAMPIPTQPKSGIWKWLAAAGIAIAFAATLLSWWRGEPARRVTRASLLPPEGTHFAPMYRNGAPALSPDGTRIAFVASREGKSSIWVRSLDKLEAAELTGTEGAYFPFWSPDGRSLGFFANGKLWREDANGGSRAAICNAPEGRGASWGQGNEIVFDGDGNALRRVSAEGGAPVALTSAAVQNQVSISDRWPFLLPDGKHFLYLHAPTGSGSDHNEIHFASIDGKSDKTLLKGRYYIPEYASGWLLVVKGGTLVAQRIDSKTGELSGEATQIADNVQIDDNTGSSLFSVSQTGVLIYIRGSSKGSMFHAWRDATGKELGPVSEQGVYGATRISPDGTKFVSQVYEQNGEIDIWMWDLKGGTRARVSSGGRNSDAPVWSPDGRTIYYSYSSTDEPVQIYAKPVDGSQAQRVVVAKQSDAFPDDVSSDGNWLVYQQVQQGRAQFAVLKAVNLKGEAKPTVLLDQIDALSDAFLMPGNNGWLAYQSSESGQPEVYLTRFPNSGARYQVSLAGGVEPVWSRDGKRLYYLDPGQKLIEADIQVDKDSVQVSGRKSLFQTSLSLSFDEAGYDVTRDGRFLMLDFVMDTPSPVTVVMNWDAELKR